MNITYRKNGKVISVGYDRMLDYAFMTIFDEDDDVLFSNMSIPNPHSIKDFYPFEEIAKERFDLDLSEITQAVDIFKININQSMEDFAEELNQEGLGHIAKLVRQ